MMNIWFRRLPFVSTLSMDIVGHSPPILAEMLDIGYIAVLVILMDLMVKYSINHHKIDF